MRVGHEGDTVVAQELASRCNKQGTSMGTKVPWSWHKGGKTVGMGLARRRGMRGGQRGAMGVLTGAPRRALGCH